MSQEGGNTVPRITKAEHIGPNDTGDNIEAKRVAVYQWSGTEWERSTGSPNPKTQRFDIQGDIIYEAYAPVGTLDDELGWEITKYDLSDLTDASGKLATDVSWDDRTSGGYA